MYGNLKMLIPIVLLLLPPFTLKLEAIGEAQKSDLRIMCYNVRNGRGMDNVEDFDRIARVIEDAEPSVVAIQELDSATQRSGGRYVLGELAQRTLMYPVYAPAIDFGGGKYGVGVLSKEKPLRTYTVALPGREEQRVLQVVEFEQYVVANCHLSLTKADRESSMKILTDRLKGCDKPVFLAGDMNSPPSSDEQKFLCQTFVYLSDTTQNTYPAPKPTTCIDYILGLKGDERFTLLRRRVVDEAVASDHRPLYIDVRLKAPKEKIVRVKPYLQNPTDGGMTVSWLTNVPTQGWVEYGLSPNHLAIKKERLVDGQVICNTTHHKVRLTDLKPATTYYYRTVSREMTLYMGYKKEFGETVHSDIYSFTTSSSEADSFTAIIYNDLHKRPELLRQLASTVEEAKADMVFFNGDCIDDPSDENDAVGFLKEMCETVGASERPIFIIRGNHEIRNAYSIELRDLIDYVNDKTYNAFTWGDTRFVVLDCGEDKPDSTWVYYGLNDFTQLRIDQAKFLATEIKGDAFTKASRKVLLHHIPIYGMKQNGFNPCRELWEPILRKTAFDVAINAHTHKFNYIEKGRDNNPFPVVWGGGNRTETATVMVLTKRGKDLSLKVLNSKGELLIDKQL